MPRRLVARSRQRLFGNTNLASKKKESRQTYERVKSKIRGIGKSLLRSRGKRKRVRTFGRLSDASRFTFGRFVLFLLVFGLRQAEEPRSTIQRHRRFTVQTHLQSAACASPVFNMRSGGHNRITTKAIESRDDSSRQTFCDIRYEHLRG